MSIERDSSIDLDPAGADHIRRPVSLHPNLSVRHLSYGSFARPLLEQVVSAPFVDGTYFGPMDPFSVAEAIEPVEGDAVVHNFILGLRARAEQDDDYRRVIARAEDQIDDLPLDIISQLLSRTETFIAAMPTGHSRGHLSRDLVNLTSVLQDPRTKDYSDAEIIAGIVGGAFHDYGNSVMDKDRERGRLAKHAEIGAWLAEQQFADLLPPDLLTVAQLGIAQHTKFELEQDVVRDGEYLGTRQPYQVTVLGDETKRALALTRSACRTDIQSIIMLFRHLPLSLRARDLYLATGEIRTAETDDSANMAKLFSLDRSRDGALLPYFSRVATNAVTPNWHTIDDTPYLTNELWGPNANSVDEFVETVHADPDQEVDVDFELERFLNLCHLLEPGYDVEEVLDNARRGFKLVDPTVQRHWATGFKLAVEQLYPTYHDRMSTYAANVPAFAAGRSSTVRGIVEDVHARSRRVLQSIDPRYVSVSPDQHPDITQVLVT